LKYDRLSSNTPKLRHFGVRLLASAFDFSHQNLYPKVLQKKIAKTGSAKIIFFIFKIVLSETNIRTQTDAQIKKKNESAKIYLLKKAKKQTKK
jgi:hypothetical protein